MTSRALSHLSDILITLAILASFAFLVWVLFQCDKPVGGCVERESIGGAIHLYDREVSCIDGGSDVGD